MGPGGITEVIGTDSNSSMYNRPKDAILDVNLTKAEEDTEKNEEAYAELIQSFDDKSLLLIMKDASDDERKALRIRRDHYSGKGKPRVISPYNAIMSLKKDCNESITKYIIRAETILTTLRNAQTNKGQCPDYHNGTKRLTRVLQPFFYTRESQQQKTNILGI